MAKTREEKIELVCFILEVITVVLAITAAFAFNFLNSFGFGTCFLITVLLLLLGSSRHSSVRTRSCLKIRVLLLAILPIVLFIFFFVLYAVLGTQIGKFETRKTPAWTELDRLLTEAAPANSSAKFLLSENENQSGISALKAESDGAVKPSTSPATSTIASPSSSLPSSLASIVIPTLFPSGPHESPLASWSVDEVDQTRPQSENEETSAPAALVASPFSGVSEELKTTIELIFQGSPDVREIFRADRPKEEFYDLLQHLPNSTRDRRLPQSLHFLQKELHLPLLDLAAGGTGTARPTEKPMRVSLGDARTIFGLLGLLLGSSNSEFESLTAELQKAKFISGLPEKEAAVLRHAVMDLEAIALSNAPLKASNSSAPQTASSAPQTGAAGNVTHRAVQSLMMPSHIPSEDFGGMALAEVSVLFAEGLKADAAEDTRRQQEAIDANARKVTALRAVRNAAVAIVVLAFLLELITWILIKQNKQPRDDVKYMAGGNGDEKRESEARRAASLAGYNDDSFEARAQAIRVMNERQDGAKRRETDASDHPQHHEHKQHNRHDHSSSPSESFSETESESVSDTESDTSDSGIGTNGAGTIGKGHLSAPTVVVKPDAASASVSADPGAVGSDIISASFVTSSVSEDRSFEATPANGAGTDVLLSPQARSPAGAGLETQSLHAASASPCSEFYQSDHWHSPQNLQGLQGLQRLQEPRAQMAMANSESSYDGSETQSETQSNSDVSVVKEGSSSQYSLSQDAHRTLPYTENENGRATVISPPTPKDQFRCCFPFTINADTLARQISSAPAAAIIHASTAHPAGGDWLSDDREIQMESMPHEHHGASVCAHTETEQAQRGYENSDVGIYGPSNRDDSRQWVQQQQRGATEEPRDAPHSPPLADSSFLLRHMPSGTADHSQIWIEFAPES